MNVTKVSQITSRTTGQPTKLIGVITESNNQVNAAQKCGLKIGWQLYRCEASREPPHVMQCFKCQKFGHSARVALMKLDVFAARKIIVLKNALLQKEKPNAQTVAVHMRQFIEADQHNSIS